MVLFYSLIYFSEEGEGNRMEMMRNKFISSYLNKIGRYFTPITFILLR